MMGCNFLIRCLDEVSVLIALKFRLPRSKRSRISCVRNRDWPVFLRDEQLSLLATNYYQLPISFVFSFSTYVFVILYLMWPFDLNGCDSSPEAIVCSAPWLVPSSIAEVT